jgi:hypothetical protein
MEVVLLVQSKFYFMKKIFFAMIVVLGLSTLQADAQYVRRKPGFSVNISFNSHGPRPYRDAVWMNPEWRWRNGRYVEVQGHWVRRSHGVWVPGRWVYTRRGYYWRPGYWR